ncbi:MAG: TolC family protein [Balneolaceae bacterium]|nr:TolC family protein [Balneolaceae bacterium]
MKRYLITTLFLFAAVSLPARSQDLNRYIERAAEHNPELKASFHRYLASLEKLPQVNTLPDPELAFGYFVSPIETRVGPQQARLGLTQMFPWFGTLETRRDKASYTAKMQFEQFQEVRNRVYYRVKDTWYRLFETRRAIDIIDENIAILESFESLTLQRLETAQASQVDVLRVQIELEELRTRRAHLQDLLKTVQQEMLELIGAPGDSTVEPPGEIDIASLEETEEHLRRQVMQQNPGLNRLEFQARAAGSAVKLARKSGSPSFGLGIDYIVTGERDLALEDNGRDAVMARAAIKIPLYRKKYNALEKQTEMQLSAAEEDRAAYQNQLVTRFEQAYRRYLDAERRYELYDQKQIQRTRQAIDILVANYSAGEADFEEILRLQRKLLDFQLARVEAAAGISTSVAFIDYLSGANNMEPEAINRR